MPQFVAAVTFESADAKTTIIKNLVIPVRDPQGEKKLERNYIYTVNAVIKYLDINTDIDYNGKKDYLQWAITKWTVPRQCGWGKLSGGISYCHRYKRW